MSLQTYIAEGFMEDCEQLIHRLTENYQQVDWHKFCYFWKEMQFDILYYGRQSGPEVVEFTEELLQTARLYMVTETDNFEDQVIGVFIAYAITIIQPYKNLCALRLVPRDVQALKKIEAKARVDGRSDVLMILGKLYIYGHIQCHVSLRERAMDITIRKYFDGSTNVPQCIARRWHGRMDRHTVYALEDVAQMESKYIDLKLKAKLAAESAFPGTNVKMDMFKPEAKHLAESLRKLISEAPEEIRKEEEPHDATSLKRKAMKNVVDPMRHLHGLDERKKGKETNSRINIKTKPRNRCRKLSPPKPIEQPLQGLSLPDLDDDPDDQIDRRREGSPQEAFRGFTAHEIQLNNTEINLEPSTSKSLGIIDLEPSTSKSLDMIDLEPSTSNGKTNSKGIVKSSYVNPADKTGSKLSVGKKIKANKKRSPKNNEVNKNSTDQEPNTKKRKLKDKLKKRLHVNKDFNSDNSDEPEIIKKARQVNNIINTETCKGKELTIQTKGVVKHFVEFEVNDIIIRTEKDAAQKDIEIEYIDNYTGTNDLYETICEVSDDEESKKVKKKVDSSNQNEPINDAVSQSDDEVEVVIEECDEFGNERHDDDDDDDDNMEVFQIINEDNTETHSIVKKKVKPKQKKLSVKARSTMIEDSSSDDGLTVPSTSDGTVKKTMSKDPANANMERRRLKQPKLRSKLKKMGILTVANFEDGSD